MLANNTFTMRWLKDVDYDSFLSISFSSVSAFPCKSGHQMDTMKVEKSPLASPSVKTESPAPFYLLARFSRKSMSANREAHFAGLDGPEVGG
jgi:hypothetical protein